LVWLLVGVFLTHVTAVELSPSRLLLPTVRLLLLLLLLLLLSCCCGGHFHA
jgi:hypothetical protein